MGRLDDEGQDFAHRVVDVDDVHLRPGNHDIADTGFGGRQGPFNDGQRVGIEQIALVGAVQCFKELLAVFRFA